MKKREVRVHVSRLGPPDRERVDRFGRRPAICYWRIQFFGRSAPYPSACTVEAGKAGVHVCECQFVPGFNRKALDIGIGDCIRREVVASLALRLCTLTEWHKVPGEKQKW